MKIISSFCIGNNVSLNSDGKEIILRNSAADLLAKFSNIIIYIYILSEWCRYVNVEFVLLINSYF